MRLPEQITRDLRAAEEDRRRVDLRITRLREEALALQTAADFVEERAARLALAA